MKCALSGFDIFLRQFENHLIGFDNYHSNGNYNYSKGNSSHRLKNDSVPFKVESLWENHFQYFLVGNVLIGLFLFLSNSLVILGLIKTCNEIKIPQKLFIMSPV